MLKPRSLCVLFMISVDEMGINVSWEEEGEDDELEEVEREDGVDCSCRRVRCGKNTIAQG